MIPFLFHLAWHSRLLLGFSAVDDEIRFVRVADALTTFREHHHQVKSTQQWWRQAAVHRHRGLQVITGALFFGATTILCCHHAAARAQATYQARFGHRYRLLLHRLVHGSLVMTANGGEFVDATDTAIRQDQGASLEHPVCTITYGRAREPCAGTTKAAGAHAARQLLCSLKQLRLAGARVAQQQEVWRGACVPLFLRRSRFTDLTVADGHDRPIRLALFRAHEPPPATGG
mmetsp:Transcript_13562/g.29955  ORF Transcript_13562/g.29955 Transcript_13562/m.29955 type:complete len:231 (+) Transcript_13562:723-1415(+)